ncbi:uncharacterized protein BDZ99DRAFT_360672, partial [Mytilinidion resinicola]
CIICTDALPPTSFPPQPPTAHCTHSPQVCTADLDAWIRSSLTTKGPAAIGCPECGNHLTHPDIHRLAAPLTLAAFETAQTRALLSADPNFRWCLSAAACGSGQLHASGRAGPIMTCGACGFKQCVIHERAWHEGLTCREFDERV